MNFSSLTGYITVNISLKDLIFIRKYTQFSDSKFKHTWHILVEIMNGEIFEYLQNVKGDRMIILY